jgi:hypothetical protein
MNITVIILYIGIFSIAVYFLFSWLNRGKKQLKNLIPTMIYSIAVGGTVFFASIAKEKPHPLLYFAVVGGLTVYPVSLMVLDVIKRRQGPIGLLLFLTGLISAVITPYLPVTINYISAFGSWIFFAGFFIYLRAYPLLNFMWLEDAVKKSGEIARKPCKYSSKPVVIFKDFNKRWVSRLKGFLLLIKKDRAIISMDKKLHTKLGCPNLMEFGERLVNIILDKTNDKKK